MPRATLVLSVVLAPLLGACGGSGAFVCADDQACDGVGPGARCEANGWCSRTDEGCGSGRRYGVLAGDGLGGVCVGNEDATGGASSSGPSTTRGPSLDGSTGTGDDTGVDTGPPPVASWWDCGWAARRELALDVPDTGEVLTDVPVLVVLDASRIDPSIMAADGHDLRFVADDDATVLPHEIEQWSPEALSWAWVRVPELSPGRTRLWMYYGNPAAEPREGTSVWSDYTGVWHMGRALADAAGVYAPGVTVATPAAGQVGPAQRFTPPTDGIELEPPPAVDGLFARGGTITAMIRPSGWGGNGIGLIAARASTMDGAGGFVLSVDASRQALRFARGFTEGTRTWYSTDGSLQLDTWHHVGVVYQDDPRGEPKLYVDGAPQGLIPQGEGTGRPEPDTAPTMYLGGVPNLPAVTFDGILDELRMAPRPRSTGWMTVEVAVLRDELASYGAPQGSPCEQ